MKMIYGEIRPAEWLAQGKLANAPPTFVMPLQRCPLPYQADYDP